MARATGAIAIFKIFAIANFSYLGYYSDMNMRNFIVARKVIDTCELTQNEAMVLDVLGNGSVIVSAIVIFTGLRNAAVSRVLNDLHKRGLIAREISDNDRRSVVVNLTKMGTIVYERLQQELEKIP